MANAAAAKDSSSSAIQNYGYECFVILTLGDTRALVISRADSRRRANCLDLDPDDADDEDGYLQL